MPEQQSPGRESWIRNNTPSPGSHLTQRERACHTLSIHGDLCQLSEHVLLYTLFVRHAFPSRKLTNQLSLCNGADVAGEADKKSQKEKSTKPTTSGRLFLFFLWRAIGVTALEVWNNVGESLEEPLQRGWEGPVLPQAMSVLQGFSSEHFYKSTNWV